MSRNSLVQSLHLRIASTSAPHVSFDAGCSVQSSKQAQRAQQAQQAQKAQRAHKAQPAQQAQQAQSAHLEDAGSSAVGSRLQYSTTLSVMGGNVT